MSERYTMEESIRIYDDYTGEQIYIGPDDEKLGFVEIRNRGNVVTFNDKEQALMVARAIEKLYG